MAKRPLEPSAPGKLAIAGFCPPLNLAGNSVRGLTAVCEVADAINLFSV